MQICAGFAKRPTVRRIVGSKESLVFFAPVAHITYKADSWQISSTAVCVLMVLSMISRSAASPPCLINSIAMPTVQHGLRNNGLYPK